MKKIYLLAVAAAGLLATTGCSDENDLYVGEGTLILSATYNSDVKVISRTDSEQLAQELGESTLIWISNDKGLVRQFEGIDDIPAGGVKLVAGHYIAEAWAGDSLSADWEKKYYKGVTEFDITNGTVQVGIECKIANVVASVVYDDKIDDALTDYTMTVGHRRGSLEFIGRDQRKGYYMMPSSDHNLTWTLTGTQSDGSTFTKTGEILDVQPATEYILTVKYNPQNEEIGGAFIEVVVDEETIDFEDGVTVMAAPRIDGIGFDLNKAVVGEPGTIGKRSVYVTGAVSLTNVVVESEDLTEIIGGPDVDLMEADQEIIELLHDAGIYFQLYDVVADKSNMKISFDEEYTDALDKGEHIFVIKATDENGKSKSATLTINVSDAPVIASPATNVSYFTATLNGEVTKAGVEEIGFNYRKVGTQAWTHVDGTLNGSEYTAQLTDLVDRTTYEYVATSKDYTSLVVETFTTLSAQLPNSSFEDWYTYNGKIYIPGTDYTTNFWDSGNHGSTTMGGESNNITKSSTDYVHSGKYSAYLRSKFVGVMTIGKFAAGNIFAGKYLDTDGMDGVLGWGRPFTHSPKSVKVWAKYIPKASDRNGSGNYLPQGTLDQGIIYMALVDDTKSDYKGEQWPCVIKTKPAEQQLFDKNGDNVIAYGEHVFETATEGNGLVLIEFNLEYKKEGVTPSNIIFVASASRYGDYFQGGEGSELYIDDIEFIYY